MEAPLWSETLSKSADIEYMAFPRLPGIAELGWSPAATHDWDAYKVRLSHGRLMEGAVEARIEALTTQQYATPRIAATREQLVKATVRLAELLNRINWK